MKRYKMLLFAVIVFMATAVTFIYENRAYPPSAYKTPALQFQSDKFGEIRNIEPIRNFYDSMFLVLSTNANNNSSTLSGLDINKNTHSEFFSFNTHNIIQDKLLVDIINGRVVYISKEGPYVARVFLGQGENKDEIQLHPTFVEIKDFENTTSAAFDYEFYYSKNNDNLIHRRNLENGFDMYNFMNSQKPREESSYYKNPLSIVAVNDMDKIIYYTKSSKDGLNLLSYNMERNPNSKAGILAKNFVHGKPTEIGVGITGIYEEDNNFKVFLVNRFDPMINIATIPKNTDALGQVPDMYSIIFNEEYYCVYSSFDENHMGSIYLKTHIDSTPKEILKNQPIVGPIKLFRSGTSSPAEGELRFNIILFTTLEEGKIHVKIYNINSDTTEDLTKFF